MKDRFNELLEKRKNLTADMFEEEELIELSKNLTKEELDNIDKELLIPSNSQRLDNIKNLLDKLDNLIETKKLSANVSLNKN